MLVRYYTVLLSVLFLSCASCKSDPVVGSVGPAGINGNNATAGPAKSTDLLDMLRAKERPELERKVLESPEFLNYVAEMQAVMSQSLEDRMKRIESLYKFKDDETQKMALLKFDLYYPQKNTEDNSN
ncbi:hypothetical protein [Candidatus Liberibacter sp.]|uniref:hypothetical protein n=1 Tax=Candidatus Liberibacter sp. TaxID=34022 RepID=UPI0015F558B8|nr:hypothetical protein [Candidatus Liberibacter sp.]MBA5723893.1 hypothetical protein [Candidatus Liberibacter sp.]